MTLTTAFQRRISALLILLLGSAFAAVATFGAAPASADPSSADMAKSKLTANLNDPKNDVSTRRVVRKIKPPKALVDASELLDSTIKVDRVAQTVTFAVHLKNIASTSRYYQTYGANLFSMKKDYLGSFFIANHKSAGFDKRVGVIIGDSPSFKCSDSTVTLDKDADIASGVVPFSCLDKIKSARFDSSVQLHAYNSGDNTTVADDYADKPGLTRELPLTPVKTTG